ncbi:alpha/beta hydrolase family protein [Pseudalkalibacillus sp. Hm43]|uniref:alpha/beta hydrolase family protein n=1 Tax=Pseudalkalibacillus sp. Hm43 TaxID=3450742 RepID=UPI003F41D4CC
MRFTSYVLYICLSLLILSSCSNPEKTKHPVIVNQEDYILFDTPYSKNVEAKRITYLSDDFEVAGFIVKPKKIDGKLPLLIFNRGGNKEYDKLEEKILSNYLAFWAEKGYVVLASQYRGNDGGEGEEEFGGSDINDVLNLQKVAEELPYVDSNKKVMLGISRGGMMTYLAIKNDMDIDAAAVISGTSNLFDLYNKRGEKMKSVLEELVGTPKEEKAEYEKRSSVYWADEINVPILIVHGAKDEQVPVEQARTLTKELKKNNKDYRFVEYPDADHSISSHFKESSIEIEKWFNHHLKN